MRLVKTTVTHKKKQKNLPLRSAAPPLMIRATITAPVASSRLMVAPWRTDEWMRIINRKEQRPLSPNPFSLPPCSPVSSYVFISTLVILSELTRGSLFFTSLTIFTDSSSSSSSKSSGSGGSTGSKFFWATVSCTERTAWWDIKGTCWDYNADFQLLGSAHSGLTSARICEQPQRWISSATSGQMKSTTKEKWPHGCTQVWNSETRALHLHISEQKHSLDRWRTDSQKVAVHLEMWWRQQVQQLLLLSAHWSTLQLLRHLPITTHLKPWALTWCEPWACVCR